ncbi:MAG: TIGR04438 family Trp-rich protein [Pseudomonadota bacterium]|nr:TIGR04438 family Trp-rich protein [Pseudomonadota bacterium]
MLFVAIGVVLIALNLAGIGPVGRWNWDVYGVKGLGDLWKFMLPFFLAVLWWIWSDVSGMNKRREMERMEKKKQDRRKGQLASLGMDENARRKKRAR